MYPQLPFMLDALKLMVRQDVLTPTKIVSAETFVCLAETNAQHGKIYRQCPLSDLPESWQNALMNRKAGDTVHTVKILAVFDIWQPELVKAHETRAA